MLKRPATFGLLGATTPPPGDLRQERRSASRRRVVLRGMLVFGDPLSSFECAIKNLSETGARVRVPAQVSPPNEVWLVDVSEGVAYEGRVSWRGLPEVGLKFSERHDLSHPKPGPVLRLRTLWLEFTGR
jgi:hypothetical protein